MERMHKSPGRPVNMQVLLGQAWGRAGDPAWLVLDRGPPLAPCRVPGARTEAERGATTETPPRALWLGPLGGGREGPTLGQLPGVAGRTGRRRRCWSRRKTSEGGCRVLDGGTGRGSPARGPPPHTAGSLPATPAPLPAPPPTSCRTDPCPSSRPSPGNTRTPSSMQEP